MEKTFFNSPEHLVFQNQTKMSGVISTKKENHDVKKCLNFFLVKFINFDFSDSFELTFFRFFESCLFVLISDYLWIFIKSLVKFHQSVLLFNSFVFLKITLYFEQLIIFLYYELYVHEIILVYLSKKFRKNQSSKKIIKIIV